MAHLRNTVVTFECQTYGYSELKLFERGEDTCWVFHHSNLSNYNIERRYFFNEISVIDNTEQIAELLSGKVYGCVGVAVHKSSNSYCIYYYLVMIPNGQRKFNLYFVLNKCKQTGGLYKRFDMSNSIHKLEAPQSWTLPHEKVCVEMFGDKLFVFFALSSQIELFGYGNVKNSNSVLREFNHITIGADINPILNRKQISNIQKRTLEHDVLCENVLKRKALGKSPESYVMPNHTTRQFLDGADITDKSGYKLSNRDSQAYLRGEVVKDVNGNQVKIKGFKGRFGNRSKDCGGKVAIVPVLSNLDGSVADITRSEMHVVTTIPNIFSLEHSFKTLHRAISALRETCPVADWKEVQGAVASYLMEDVSWRMVEDPPCEHVIKQLKVDIDQVRNFLFDICLY
jgi:hypothetical protein